MDDREFDGLLRRYRPTGPPPDLERRVIKAADPQITRSPASWPWAIAAAVLLAVTVGLHGAVASPPGEVLVADPGRVRLLAHELGTSPESQELAQWLAMAEAKAEHDRLAQAAAPQEAR